MRSGKGIFVPIILSEKRQSQYELLRLISQFYIILYHICYFWQGKESEQVFFKTIGIPLHIGVLIFVLLSGFFTIKPTSKSLIKLLGIFLFYDVGEIAYNVIHAENIGTAIKHFLFISDTHFWFIKTYLFLYLVSPMLNKWLEVASSRQRWYITSVFGFVASYMAMTGGDHNMEDGKNLVNFIFLYFVGNQIKYYEDFCSKLKICYLIICYLFLNIFLFTIAYLSYGTNIYELLFKLSFPYSSPLLLINAILLFIIVGKVEFKSNVINYFAQSSLAIYLIHANMPYVSSMHEKVAIEIQRYCEHNIALFFSYMVYTAVVLCFCIFIDKLLTPIWNIINTIGNKVYAKLGY